MAISTRKADSLVTLDDEAIFYSKSYEFTGVKELAFQIILTKGTSVEVDFSIQVSCDGENWADYKVGGTLVKENMTDAGVAIIAIETPCIFVRAKYNVIELTGDATVALTINGKD
jgi:hypothetical protein